MALTFHSGFESGNTFEWASVVGSTITIQQTIKKTGTYAMRCNTSAAAAYVTLPSSAKRITFYLFITSVNADSIIATGLTLTSTRYLKYYFVTGATQLAIGTWYRISISISGEGSNQSAKIYINGNIELNLSIVDSEFFTDLGNLSATTVDLYFDDVAADAVNDLTDLGDIRTLLSLPNAAGQYSDFDTVVPAGTHYTTYDDPPGGIDDADYVQQAGKTQVRDTAGLQDCTTIGIGASDTLQAVNVLARMVDNTTGGITVRDNGTDYDYVKAAGKTAAWFSQYFAVMPNDSAAWTQIRFDAFQAGGLSSGGTTDTYLYALMVMVAYIPVGVAPPTGTVYLVTSTGKRTQVSTGATAIKIDPTTGRRGTSSAFSKYLVRTSDGKLQAQS